MLSFRKKITALAFCLILGFGIFAFAHTTHALSTVPAVNPPGSSSGLQMSQSQNPNSCGWTNVGQCVKDGFAWILYIIVVALAGTLKLAGLLLDLSIKYSVIDMSTHIKNITSIGIAWATIRDFANMFFIFILLTVAIQTILQVSSANAKRTLVQIVIAAILINFSIFFTKIIVDASNILTRAFYEQLLLNGSLSDRVMQSLGLGAIFYDPGSVISLTDKGWPTLISMALGSIVILFTSIFSFLAVAFMMIYRYAIIVILIVLSPLAFLGGVLPQIKGQTKKWWDTLIGQALFPVIYMLMLWVSLTILSGTVSKLTGGSTLGSALTAGQKTDPSPEMIGALFNFIIIIILMNAALLIAKGYAVSAGGLAASIMNKGLSVVDKIQGKGRDVAGRLAGKATAGVAGAALRTTAGRVGASLSGSRFLNKTALEGGIIGRNLSKAVIQTGKAAEKSTFDARNIKTIGASLGQGVKGGYTERLEQKGKDVIASVEQYGGASEETAEKISKARAEIVTHQKNYFAAIKNKDSAGATESMRQLRAVSGKIAKAEKEKTKEISAQQTAYVSRLGTSRSKGRLWIKTASKYKSATEQYLKKIRPASEEDSLKASAADFKIQISNAKDAAEVKKILGGMKDAEIGKLGSDAFIKKDKTSGVESVITDVIDNLKPGHLESLRKELTTGQKTLIREYVEGIASTPGAAVPVNIQNLNTWLQGNRGKDW